MSGRSFERLNYSLRPNKNVERKLLVELLGVFRALPGFVLDKYRYVGLSSIYYADAILFHKRLGINDIVSIEKEESRSKRARFNRPYSCVEVILGPSSAMLRTLEWKKPQLVWLDYDGVLDRSLFADAETVLTRLQSRDFFFVTVNAEVAQLLDVVQDERELKPEEVLEQAAPDGSIPGDLHGRLTGNGFPPVVAEIWDNFLRSVVLNRAINLRFLPLLNMTYSDGARMVTFGGVVVDEKDERLVQELLDSAPLDYVASPEQFKLTVPQLTHREKSELDRWMPSAVDPSVDDLPFELRPTEVAAFRRFYLHYPNFGEFAP